MALELRSQILLSSNGSHLSRGLLAHITDTSPFQLLKVVAKDATLYRLSFKMARESALLFWRRQMGSSTTVHLMAHLATKVCLLIDC